MLGSGSIVVMDDSTCVVRAAWRITRFFHRESCGQCTPCREGSGWLEKILQRIEQGYGREEDLDLLMDVCDNISPGVSWPPQQTTICVLGPSIPSSIASGIRMFRDEFLAHITGGGCPFGATRDRHPRQGLRGGRGDDLDHRRRDADQGTSWRAHHRRGRAGGRIRPAILLPPAHGSPSACAGCASSRYPGPVVSACSRRAS